MEILSSVGRRKASIARIFLKKGKGDIIVNKKTYLDYFKETRFHYSVEQPMSVLDFEKDKYDIFVNVEGGGIKGQAEAIRLGIARVLVKFNEENKPVLKKNNFLTRDSRKVERKKPGQKKARKRFQFSKR